MIYNSKLSPYFFDDIIIDNDIDKPPGIHIIYVILVYYNDKSGCEIMYESPFKRGDTILDMTTEIINNLTVVGKFREYEYRP